MICI
jgi:exonuclease III